MTNRIKNLGPTLHKKATFSRFLFLKYSTGLQTGNITFYSISIATEVIHKSYSHSNSYYSQLKEKWKVLARRHKQQMKNKIRKGQKEIVRIKMLKRNMETEMLCFNK